MDEVCPSFFSIRNVIPKEITMIFNNLSFERCITKVKFRNSKLFRRNTYISK